MMDLSFASVDLRAWHTDRHPDPAVNEGRHQHTWRVTAYFETLPGQDMRGPRGSLRALLERWTDQDLPAQLSLDQGLARMAFNGLLHRGCVGVRVARDEEGYGATVGTVG